MWRPGRKLQHPFNPELGVGEVLRVEGRFLTVRFPDADQELTLAAEGSGLSPLVLPPGARVCLRPGGEEAEVAAVEGDGYRLTDGRLVDDADVWPLAGSATPCERLAALRVEPVAAFRNRLEGMQLAALREAGGLGSFLGGRVELFPHQLHTARRAASQDPVRWLLADEVGLGKTIEACLILSALVRTGRAGRVLVVVPSALSVQWLGELYRKFHQVFVLLDPERIEATASTIGPDANPFDVHPHGVVELELLHGDAGLTQRALETPPDLLVVDEAHRLAAGGGGEALDALVRASRHALLLSATPLAADRRGFFHLLSLLHPERFVSFEAFDAALASGEAAIPCASAVRRSDVGGLPPRAPQPVDVPGLEASPERDPRARWLRDALERWAARGEKALVFVRDVETLEALQRFLESRLRTRMAIFHEHMTPARRDLEVAGFRDGGVPALLCSDAGAEGRNFQFAERLVHHDLPLDPLVLEQRIGRLDRIGRTRPVEVVYFRPEGAQPDLARLYEAIELFERPSAAIDRTLAHVGRAVRDAAEAGDPLDVESLAAEVARARAEAGRELGHVSFSDAYAPERDGEILAAVPPDLEARTRRFCVEAADQLGFDVVDKAGAALYYVEFGAGATVDSLPGLPGGTRYLGTFDRAEAVRRDELEFFASGHPLVEALLLELEDGGRGRAALCELPEGTVGGPGLLCLLDDGADWHCEVIDASGRPRPEWRAPLLAALPGARDVRARAVPDTARFAELVRSLAAKVEAPERVAAAAFFVMGEG